MRVRGLLYFVLVGPLALPLSAQVDRATLVGTVTDPTGAVIPNAQVEIVSHETGLRRQVQTSESGTYTLSQVPIGTYTVTVTQQGFVTATVKDLRLGVGDTRTLDVQLQLSGVETQVTVETLATVLETESPALGTVIGERQVPRSR